MPPLPATPAPDPEVWFQGLRWAEAVAMQSARFDDALAEHHAALTDAATRRRLIDDTSESALEHRRSYDADPEVGNRPVRVPAWALEMQLTTELDFLMVAIRNLLRAQDRLPADRVTAMKGQEVLKLLRDLAEHYDERGGRAESSLVSDHLQVLSDAFNYTNKEIWIGGGKSGVPLSRVVAWAARVEVELREVLAGIGVEIPDELGASRVEGDDALPWPATRLRFGWWLPIAGEFQWPQNDPPEGVAGLIAERFANLRARDDSD